MGDRLALRPAELVLDEAGQDEGLEEPDAADAQHEAGEVAEPGAQPGGGDGEEQGEPARGIDDVQAIARSSGQ